MSKRLTVSIINVGDELLLGIRTNSHLTYLGKQLSFLGLNVGYCQVIPDKLKAVEDSIKIAQLRSEIIIITGGLGPTKDDLTLKGVANALGRPLVYNEIIFESIKKRFAQLGRALSIIHKNQCYQLEGSKLLMNERGTAPGSIISTEESLIVLLPGPSHELNPMFINSVVPYLKKHFKLSKTPAYVQLRTCGLGESTVEEKVSPIIEKYPNAEVAFCVHLGIVDVRISMKNSVSETHYLDIIAEKCRSVLADYFVGYGSVSLAEVIYQELRERQQTLAVAESCTGGLMGNAFTDISGVSKVFQGGVVCYANAVKILQLDVPEEIIEQHGAVSSECAIAMASGVAENLSSDYGLSITGFAGPEGGTKDNPVGTIHIGLYSPIGIWAKSVRYIGGRLDVKARAVNSALDWLRRLLIEGKNSSFEK